MDPFAEYISFILLSITLSVARARTAAGRNAPAHCHYYYYFFYFFADFSDCIAKHYPNCLLVIAN